MKSGNCLLKFSCKSHGAIVYSSELKVTIVNCLVGMVWQSYIGIIHKSLPAA